MNPRILVVGGNGFVGSWYDASVESKIYTECATLSTGSAVCKAALAKGMQVISVRYESQHTFPTRVDF